MTSAVDQSILFLIGLCRESQRNLANAAWSAGNPRLRQVVLDAFDQRTEMLDDLERLTPPAEPGEPIHLGWSTKLPAVGDSPDPGLAAACIAGEEVTLRAGQALWAESQDKRLRQTLQTHILRISGMLARLRAELAKMQNH